MKSLLIAMVLGVSAPAFAASPPAGEVASEHVSPGGEAGHGHTPPPINWLDFSYQDEDVYGGTLEPGEEAKPPPFVLMLLNFGLLLVILGWKAKPALGKYADKRHREIKGALDEAARLRAEAEEKLAEYKKRIAKVDAEVDQIIADIRADAESEKKRIIADAEARAAAMKRDAESRIAAELARARADIEREVVIAAIGAAHELVSKNATSTDKSTIVDSFITDLESGPSAEERPQ